jgi:tubulinyl-Tyr carboxypeptidase
MQFQIDSEEERARKLNELQSRDDLPDPPTIALVPDLAGFSVYEIVKKVQAFIEHFQYNYTGKPFIRMNKSRGVSHIHNVSKQLIKEALPIQCVEAVFLGTTLTSGMHDIIRVPLSFKSKFIKGTVHRHIVLAIKFDGKWGAIGISRRSSLMNKPIKFNSLAELVKEFDASYEACYHRLVTVYIGLPLPHDKFVDHPIKWRATKIRWFGKPLADTTEKINVFSGNMMKLYEHFAREGCLPGRTSHTK